MKRFAKKTAVYLIPFLIALLLFYIFEPSNYFGFKDDAAYFTRPLSSMRQLMREQPANVIFGDSRMANLNTDYIKEITGEEYSMQGFGGATLGESIELFWFATEHTKMEKVMFGVSFYGAKGIQDAGRITDVEKQATNIFAFTSRLDYWLQALNSAKDGSQNIIADVLNRPDLMAEPPEDPTAFTPQDIPTERGDRYRLQLEEYADIIRFMCEGYTLESDTLRQLDEIIDYCKENHIELIFVFPPMHQSIFTNVTEPMDLDGYRNQLKDYLIGKTTVYDMEFLNDFTCNEDNFFDGFHLSSEEKKTLAQLLFTDVAADIIVRHYV